MPTSPRLENNSACLCVTNIGASTVGFAQAAAAAKKWIPLTLFPYSQLWNPAPLSLYGGIAGLVSIGLAVAIWPANGWYLRRQRQLFRELLPKFWANPNDEQTLSKLLALADDNYYILEDAGDLAELILACRAGSDLRAITSFLIGSPWFLPYALQDGKLARRITTSVEHCRRLLNAAEHSPYLNGILKECGWDCVPPVKRSLFLPPPQIRQPLTWDYLYWLGVSTGLTVGGLIAVMIEPTVAAVAAGASIGAGVLLAVTFAHYMLSPKIRKKLQGTWLDLADDWERPRQVYFESKIDMPFIVRLNFGVTTGTAIGAGLAAIPALKLGLLHAVGAGSLLFGAAALFSPHLFYLGRVIYREIFGVSIAPYSKMEKVIGRRSFYESQYDVPWYNRVFAGSQIGLLFGPIGGLVGIAAAWLSPFVVAAMQYIMRGDPLLSSKTPPENMIDTPWYINAMDGRGAASYLGKFALALMPTMLPASCIVWIAAAGMMLAIMVAWIPSPAPKDHLEKFLPSAQKMFAGGFTGQLFGACIVSIATALGISMIPQFAAITGGIGAICGYFVIPNPTAKLPLKYSELPIQQKQHARLPNFSKELRRHCELPALPQKQAWSKQPSESVKANGRNAFLAAPTMASARPAYNAKRLLPESRPSRLGFIYA